MYYKDYQQKPLFITVPDYDELFPKMSVQRVIDNFVNSLDLRDVEATYKEGGAPPYHPSVLLKVVLYAYSRNIYGCRPIADLCHMDLVCQWFTNFESPSFSTINRFRSEHLGDERTVGVFAKLVEILVSDGLVNFEECTYVDGTTIESRASRTKLVWVQSQRRFAEQNRAKIEAIVESARRAQQEDAEGLADDGGDSHDDDASSSSPASNGDKSPASSDEIGNKKKRDRSVHMSAEQVGKIRSELAEGNLNLSAAAKRELEERLEKADIYRQRDEMCGGKSGTASTDPDRVAMHPKEDPCHTGPCRPMYNVQFMTQSQFLTWFDLFGVPTDVSTFPMFLDTLPKEFTPATIAADAGYGSYENYMFAIGKGIDPYLKYSMYDKERSSRFIPDPYQAEYLPEQADGTLKCPGGTLHKIREVTETKNGVTTTEEYYRTNQCASCPFHNQCHRKYLKDYREVRRKKEWHQIKPLIKEKLDSDEGNTLLRNRTKDVEPTFAHTKWSGAYRRFRHFGIDKCRMDLAIRAIAHNLKKYTAHLKRHTSGHTGTHSHAHNRLIIAQNSAILAIWSQIKQISQNICAKTIFSENRPTFQQIDLVAAL